MRDEDRRMLVLRELEAFDLYKFTEPSYHGEDVKPRGGEHGSKP